MGRVACNCGYECLAEMIGYCLADGLLILICGCLDLLFTDYGLVLRGTVPLSCNSAA